ncbi:MAG: S46 family peptidase [Pirellulaceae bacterium]|nr:S46 family peptidase [Pirellulaceae bacterium]
MKLLTVPAALLRLISWQPLSLPGKRWAMAFFCLAIAQGIGRADEGMLPISEIGDVDLAARGIRLQAGDIFDPAGTSLVDGIVRVNGCTGSFVSPRGLILTNHHCAYQAIQANSSPDRDLLANGFIASQMSDEIPAAGFTVRITQSYQDVSKEVLSVVRPDMDYTERTKAIERQSKVLEQQAEQANSGLRAEVAEMFVGQTYGLFLYVYLRDVRLVFAPPASVGNFGGDVDNWEWPRHTGDFSFMRVYTAPDGSAADYSPNNVPYQPKRFLQVKPDGVAEGDAIMLLGYPGRTARHHTAAYLQMLRDHTLPWTVKSYQWQIAVMEEAGRNDRAIAIKHANRSKSLANVEKRVRGQLKGLNQAGLIERRQQQEAELRQFISADPQRQARYSQLLDQIAAVYAEMSQAAASEMLDRSFVDACRTLHLAYQVYDAAIERQKSDLERESAYMDRNFSQTVQQWRLVQNDLDVATDTKMLTGLLEQLIQASSDPKRRGLQPADVLGQPVDQWFAASPWSNPNYLDQVIGKTPAELAKLPDPALKWVIAMYPRLTELRRLEKQRQGRLNQLYGDLISLKKQQLSTQFVPDANATLRLTTGYVKGFSPQDAVYKSPFTTLRGLAQKTTHSEPFETPAVVLDKIAAGEDGGYAARALGQVPVNLLYDTDTTGGNSGSPIMDASGRLVGVNFDRAFEATINDFAWNADYSRSIGVDIRYVLWITGTVYQAHHLIAEMEVGVPRQDCWVFLKTGVPTANFERPQIEAMQSEHLKNFRRLHSMDRLLAAGPLGDPDRQLRGICFIRAKDTAELEQNFQADPFVQNQLLKIDAMVIAAQIGQFNSGFSIGEMEEFVCVVFRPVAGAPVDPEAARTSWEQLQQLYQKDQLRLAMRFEHTADSEYLGAAVFKKHEPEQISAWLNQLSVIQQSQVRYSLMPLYMSQGILDATE